MAGRAAEVAVLFILECTGSASEESDNAVFQFQEFLVFRIPFGMVLGHDAHIRPDDQDECQGVDNGAPKNKKKHGEVLNTINTEHKADSISVYKGTAAILDGNVVYGYNQKGDLLYSANSGTGSKKVVLASDYTAYILSVNQIRFIDLDSVSSSDTAETSKQE